MTTHNRQSRRVAQCIRARAPHSEEDRAIAPWAQGASSDELAQVAARLAQELELSPEAIDELLWGPAEPRRDCAR